VQNNVDNPSVCLRRDISEVHSPVFSIFFWRQKHSPAVSTDVNLGGLRRPFTPHSSDLFHTSCVMPKGAMHRPVFLLQLVKPEMNMLESRSQLKDAVLAVFLGSWHFLLASMIMRGFRECDEAEDSQSLGIP
jgi:hypothetical protein